MKLEIKQRVGDVENSYAIEGEYEEVYAAYIDVVEDKLIKNEDIEYEQD